MMLAILASSLFAIQGDWVQHNIANGKNERRKREQRERSHGHTLPAGHRRGFLRTKQDENDGCPRKVSEKGDGPEIIRLKHC